MVLITDNQETELKIAYTTEFTINSFEYIDKNTGTQSYVQGV